MTYWSSGGDILAARVGVLSTDDAEALLGLHRDEARAAASAGHGDHLDLTRRLARELTEALKMAWRWRRASEPLGR